MEHQLVSMGLLVSLLLGLFLASTATSVSSQDLGVEPSLRGLIPVHTHLSPDRESFLDSVRELIAIKDVVTLRHDRGKDHAYSISRGSTTLPLVITS